ncbi:MAG: hypothetical protein IJQ80_01010 [Clostridia bacterium]|nr:hypothetical protein [Clostridia bacterium]
MAELCVAPVLNEKGDTFRSAVDVSSELIPRTYLGAGDSVRLLGVYEELIVKGVFVVVSGGVEEGHIS